jgi:hypothetical protein
MGVAMHLTSIPQNQTQDQLGQPATQQNQSNHLNSNGSQ